MLLKENKNIEILKFSDVSYELLTIEIYYKGEPFLQVNQEMGKHALELEIFNDFCETRFEVKLLLSDLIEALEIVHESLEGEHRKQSKVNQDLTLLNFSNMNDDKPVGEIQFKDKSIAQINHAKRQNDLEIDIFTDFCEEKFEVKLPLDDFIEILKTAEKAFKLQ